MELDRNKLMEQGFLILREVVPPTLLEHLRESYSVIVDRQKEIWVEQRGPNDPPCGYWELSSQPRVGEVENLIDQSTANAVEIWFHENTMGVARELLLNPDPIVMGMHLMCNPVRNFGPAAWHRDIHPIDMAPLANIQGDLLENGPRYLQWNIPLYDDDVLWVVPGSHLRLNTEAENQQLLLDKTKPLPGGIPVDLKAGDGVIYINLLFHQGSNYSTKLRRTIHGAHGFASHARDLGYTEFLSSSTRKRIERGSQKITNLENATETALRSVISKEPVTYLNALETLQPGIGNKGKTLFTIYLSKAALFIHHLKGLDSDNLPSPLQKRAVSPHPLSLHWGPEFSERFTDDEAAILKQRFATLDSKLQADVEHFVPGFQSQPMRYFFEAMTETFHVVDFMESWNG